MHRRPARRNSRTWITESGTPQAGRGALTPSGHQYSGFGIGARWQGSTSPLIPRGTRFGFQDVVGEDIPAVLEAVAAWTGDRRRYWTRTVTSTHVIAEFREVLQEAHNTMADYFFSDGPGISAVVMALADAFYEAAIDQRTDA